jgi:hypothetical protein
MRNFTRWSLLVLGAFALALLGAFAYQEIPASRSLPKPFSIWYYEKSLDYDGKIDSEGSYFVGGKANGDTVKSFPGWGKDIELKSQGLFIGVRTARRMITTTGNGKLMPPTALSFGENCERDEGLTGETKMLLGFKTLKLRTVAHQKVMTEVREAWVAPELSCQVLEETSTWTIDATGAKTVTTKVATKALAQAPPDEEFVPPAGYTEVAPSVLNNYSNPRADERYLKQKAEREGLAK